ncbi:protein rogdi [Eurytemora carolleeae]|uniref:protein rogdi n=1 Tax=Eurytemora carolleeae TaxID=1294199 RepID=UPI000C762C73|nr:protein rogdi [Eurytemora carolleeae]|eukprot:XP_023320133.1 protein rogdi-like [Eurytemora affinis]
MADVTVEEIESLQREFDWVLNTEVKSVINQLKEAVQECAAKFPIPVGTTNNDTLFTTDRCTMTGHATSPPDQVKVVVTMTGDKISQADINLKLPRPHGKDVYYNTSIKEDCPWKLQQIQDSVNHLQLASDELESMDPDHEFKSAQEVKNFFSSVMVSLQRSRTSLVIPKKRTLDDLLSSKNVKSLNPPLSKEVAISFYLQSWKLIFAVYHLVVDKGASRFDRYQSECVVPWVNDVLLLLTVALQTGQQLTDKIDILAQYQQEININNDREM